MTPLVTAISPHAAGCGRMARVAVTDCDRPAPRKGWVMTESAAHSLGLQRCDERGERLFYALVAQGLPIEQAGRLASEWQLRLEQRLGLYGRSRARAVKPHM